MNLIGHHIFAFVLFFYVTLFLPVIGMNIAAWISIFPILAVFILIIFLPNSILNKLNFDILDRYRFVIPRARYYVLLKKMQEDLTGYFQYLPRKTIIEPFQRRLIDLYKNLYLAFWGGFLSGLRQSDEMDHLDTVEAKSNIANLLLAIMQKLEGMWILCRLIIIITVLSFPALLALCLLFFVIRQYWPIIYVAIK